MFLGLAQTEDYMWFETEPSRGGLRVLRDHFHRLGFPLPDFRVDVVEGTQIFGVPPIYRSRQGFSANLDALAAEDPFTAAENVALFSENGEYGLFFVNEQIALPRLLLTSTGESTNYVYVPQVVSRMRVYDEGEEFAREVAATHDHILCLAHWGRVDPSFVDMFKFFFHSKNYHFPQPASQQAA